MSLNIGTPDVFTLCRCSSSCRGVSCEEGWKKVSESLTGAPTRSRHPALQTTRAQLDHTGARGMKLETSRGACIQS